MQNRELSLLGVLDNGITTLLCFLLGTLAVFALQLLGIYFLFKWLPEVVFEYNQGFADLSLLELGFGVIFAFLLWRHTQYCRHFKTGFFSGINRVFLAQGLMCCLVVTCVALAPALLPQSALAHELTEPVLQGDALQKMAGLGLVLFTTYLAAPTSGEDQVAIIDHPESDSIEPTPAPLAATTETRL